MGTLLSVTIVAAVPKIQLRHRDARHPGQARFTGAMRSSNCFRPTPANCTVASAFSPEPLVASTVHSPHRPCTTTSPASSPSASAPVVTGSGRLTPLP